jgi:tRNA (guanine-N7-)-methyltransferase
MKPKDLRHPFPFSERRPHFSEGIFFVPSYYDKHHEFTFPTFDHPDLFGNTNPVFLEYCSGNGSWIVEKALEQPQVNWVAVEKDFERVRKIWSKIQNNNLQNLRIICGEALTFTKHYLLDASLDHIYINFPDPWPKDRHAKHRLIQPPFSLEMARVLKPCQKAILVTDDSTYCAQMCRVMVSTPSFKPSFVAPYWVSDWEGYGTSFFESLWRKKGKTIRYIQMEKEAKS